MTVYVLYVGAYDARVIGGIFWTLAGAMRAHRPEDEKNWKFVKGTKEWFLDGSQLDCADIHKEMVRP